MCQTIFLKENEAIEESDRPLVQVVHRLGAGALPVTEIYAYTRGRRPTLVRTSLDSLAVALDEARTHAELAGIEQVYVLDLVPELSEAV
ncbi:hypothetical protein SAMN06265365_13442 [Tistlia consotensis]|uniref:Uncharacterized protein n=1 Tax=Tistlia consotensis USBA 355 TaxID=560819 RepID=A0A1Y6CW43_9PROT|nr:hypothetical protein [Tistlia consotensis]SMF79051.1 hypothetical protein SAMN05428998_13942 [Tistlia consotensis USBA 355]SNS15685.1 hypothetical protein SAMN06265365_13442 [Tistlia consotensis]